MSNWKRKWSSDMLVFFASKYEQFPALWDWTLDDYKNKRIKEKTYQAFVKVLSNRFPGIDVTTAKLKIRSFRNAYTLELHKILKSKLNAVSPDHQIYKPVVPWFTIADRFLRRVIIPRPFKPNPELGVIQPLSGDDDVKYEEEEPRECSEEINSSVDVNSSSFVDYHPKRYTTTNRKKHRKRSYFENDDIVNVSTSDEPSSSAVATIKSEKSSIKSEKSSGNLSDDFYDSFGKTVVGYLKQLPEVAALQCQGRILNLLIEKCVSQYANNNNNAAFHPFPASEDHYSFHTITPEELMSETIVSRSISPVPSCFSIKDDVGSSSNDQSD